VISIEKIISITIILSMVLIFLVGCTPNTNLGSHEEKGGEEIIPQPPSLPEDNENIKKNTGEIPTPPALPEE
jgi:hypothetical protein